MESLTSLIPLEPNWNEWAGRGARIAIVLVGAGIAWWMLKVVRRRVDRVGEHEDAAQRRKTLATVLTTTGAIVIVAVSLMMILEQLGISLGPLLATAGIASLAIGFGAQTLVKDVISGIFVLLEDQYAIGDVVDAAGVSGTVEAVHLRTTILRDVHGTVHIVPNGDIRVLSNQTKGWSRAVLEVGVGYGEDPDRVIEVLEAIAAEIGEDEEFGPVLLEVPTVPGVQEFGDSAIIIRMMAKTQPLKQWDVARELRRRIKHRFDAEGIEMPYPQRVVWHRGEGNGDPEAKSGGET